MGRRRKEIDGETPEFNKRFATRLRMLLEKKGMTNRELSNALQEAGAELTYGASNAWIRGDNFPKYAHLEALGSVLLPGKDYRELLPPRPRD